MSWQPPPHPQVLQIKIKLLGVSKPPVWRRVQVRANTRLDQLHEIVQILFGWYGYHLHAFSFGGAQYGVANPELDFNDERKVRLNNLLSRGDQLRYVYDFGDNWEHGILVEDLLEADSRTRYPVLVTGKGAGPPEDCGGAWGYAELKEGVATNRGDEQHLETLKRLHREGGREFDPVAFDLDRIRAELAARYNGGG